MVPGHGASPQTSPAPYNISVVHSDLRNGVIRVRLTAVGPKNFFVGFLLRDKLSTSSSDGSAATGHFIAVPQDSAILDCGNDKVMAELQTDMHRNLYWQWFMPSLLVN